MKQILIIEDERDLAELVSFNLEKEGFGCIICLDGDSGLKMTRKELPDLLLLDLMLPGMMGTEVCRQIKAAPETAHIPVIMLTARGEEIDRVVGLEMGADDYIVKPFSMRELILRIHAVLRRSSKAEEPASDTNALIRTAGISIDTDRCRVETADGEAVLTTTEYKLLLYLAQRPGRVQSRDLLLQEVWGYNYVGDTRTVDTHITRLRSKLGPAGDAIRTVRGFGYSLEG